MKSVTGSRLVHFCVQRLAVECGCRANALCPFLTVSFSIVRGSGGTFKQQLELMASHGIFVSPHGANLMNTMYMPPASAIIEMFPYHLDHNLYYMLALMTGSASYPIHAINASIVWANDPVRGPSNFTVKC